MSLKFTQQDCRNPIPSAEQVATQIADGLQERAAESFGTHASKTDQQDLDEHGNEQADHDATAGAFASAETFRGL